MPLFPWFGSFVPQHMCSSQEAPEIPFSCRTSWDWTSLRTGSNSSCKSRHRGRKGKQCYAY
eukprot:scaffold15414_cov16-Tisochrysis_lutea.AAC.1